MEVGDKFTWKSRGGETFLGIIINKNEFREPSELYLVDGYKEGEYVGEVFAGESFFEQNDIKLVEKGENERGKEWN